MASNDEIIERWLEEELLCEDDLQNADYSDVDVNIYENFVLGEDSGSDSEIGGEEVTDLVEENTEFPRQTTRSVSFSADDDEIPLQQLRTRPRKKHKTFSSPSATTGLRDSSWCCGK